MKKPLKKRTVKAWAIVHKYQNNGIVYGGQCGMGIEHEHFSSVFLGKIQAKLAKKLHSEFYKNCKIVPVTITYKA